MEEGSCFQKPIREQGAQGTDFVYHMFLSGDRMCPFSVFNSLALCSLPPLSVQKKERAVCYLRVCVRERIPVEKVPGGIWLWGVWGPGRGNLLVRCSWLCSSHLLCWALCSCCTEQEGCTGVLSIKRSSFCLEPLKITDLSLTELVQYDLAGPHRRACLGHRAVVCRVCW